MTEENPDRVFYRTLYNTVERFIKELNGEFNYDKETMRRLVRMKFIEMESMMLGFAKKKKWLTETEHELCDLHLKQRIENGRCPNCN